MMLCLFLIFFCGIRNGSLPERKVVPSEADKYMVKISLPLPPNILTLKHTAAAEELEKFKGELLKAKR